ncbi:hypothetical protein ATZ33_14880 [Enterococcus silesiacus]|uniref:AraC family transcriptional regulator n=1 Tax=Enterococcus silesiacus TaxID=332949 RepID=A0A0S3KEG7_9ENTE|nr:helix-turn-helix transcriptional regulator [Enterococcus silesiacus]ALS02612.1 hypothetical protein ATZ33_14880 [Enterococcus silesiacus]OJG93462.1 AraC family transcriptional regulator [Enterococcus silesiacus]
MNENIEEIILFMKKNAAMSIRIEDVAAHFGYSKSHFSREFKKATGLSPNEYLASLKIEQSIDTLTQGHSVIESQLDAGHQSPGTFTTTFTKNTGLSPRVYAKGMSDLFELSKKHEHIDKDSDSLYYRNPAFEIKKSPYFLTVYIDAPEDFKGLIFSGLFLKPNPNHLPVMGRCRVKNYRYEFYDLPDGTYYPLVCGIRKSLNVFNYFLLDNSMRAYDGQKITFPLTKDEVLHITLREKGPTDPPILINLPNILANGIKQQMKRNQKKIAQTIKKAK